MEYDPQDQDVVRLLTKLKDVHGEYPENMLMARRQSYLQRMTEIGLGSSAGQGIQDIAKSFKPPRTASTASTLLESALIIAVVTEASLMAYFYRDQLVDFFQDLTTSAGAEEATPVPAIPTDLEGQEISPSPAVTSTLLPTILPTEIKGTLTDTPIPGDLNSNRSTAEIKSTPSPNGDNGNHYGQTPKPERTKDNNGNNGNNGNNDKPPKKKTPKR